MAAADRFIVNSQLWLKLVLALAKVVAASLAALLLVSVAGSSDPSAWITAIAVSAGCGWLVLVGLDHMRFFGAALHVEGDLITITSGRTEREFCIDELTLRTRPTANALELHHATARRIFLADMYANNSALLLRLFAQRFKHEA